MPIQANTAPVVQLPVTGIDPTQAASPAGVVPPAPQLSAADQALIAETQARFAKPADAPTAGTTAEGVLYQPQDAVTPPTGDSAPSTEPGATTTPVEGSAPPELTTSQKLAAKIASKKAQVIKLNEEIEKLEGQFRAVDLLDGVKPSSIIVARVGRAETSREVEATVLGVQTLPNGDLRYKVYFGEGFDAETVVIQSSQIVDVKQV